MRTAFLIQGEPFTGFDATDANKKYLGQYWPCIPTAGTLPNYNQPALTLDQAMKWVYRVSQWILTGQIYLPGDAPGFPSIIFDGIAQPVQFYVPPDSNHDGDPCTFVTGIERELIKYSNGNYQGILICNATGPAASYGMNFYVGLSINCEGAFSAPTGTVVTPINIGTIGAASGPPPAISMPIYFSGYYGLINFANYYTTSQQVGSITVDGKQLPISQDPPDNLGIQFNLTLDPYRYYEYRDSEGNNPIYDATTGAQLLNPFQPNL